MGGRKGRTDRRILLADMIGGSDSRVKRVHLARSRVCYRDRYNYIDVRFFTATAHARNSVAILLVRVAYF